MNADALLVLKIEQSGESFQRLSLLTSEDTALQAMHRISKKKPAPDLFETIEAHLEKGNKGGLFLKDWVTHQRRIGIGNNYQALCCASEFANFLLLNLRHADSFTDLYELTCNAYNAWNAGKAPQCTLFKAYYKLLQGEGYPVRQEWLATLPADQQTSALHFLKTPLAEVNQSDDELNTICQSLKKWITTQAEWRLPS
jgi:recombinational DNA repair protein (RecF pathway)